MLTATRSIALAKTSATPDVVVERAYENFKQWRGLATRYDKLAVIFRGAAILRSIIMWLRSPLGDTP